MNQFNFKHIILTILVAAVTSFIIMKMTKPEPLQQNKVVQEVKSDALDRILASKTLRCGYINYPPYFSKDPNTGKESGLMVDVMRAIADKMQVKLEWSYETTWTTMFEDMKAGRFDAVCSDVWQNTARAIQADFSTPVVYSVLEAWVRADDMRFDGRLGALNSAEVTIPILDGEAAQQLVKDHFPKVKSIPLPQNAPYGDVMMNIVTGKADVAFLEPQVAKDYLKTNPSSLRRVENVPPVAEFPVTIVLPKNNPRLKTVIDTAIMEIKSTPALSMMLDKYGMTGNVIVK
jgi:ABC-type amino acid transport substrate-binding protein